MGELIDGYETKQDTGELIYRKKLKPDANLKFIGDPLKYDIEFGPRYFDASQTSFLVPVESRYHNMLFPEVSKEYPLFPDLNYQDSFSNAMRKAYICASNSTLLYPGCILFFYKSHGAGTIQTCGIVERIERESNPDTIISITGKRTVYQKTEIEEMCKNKKKLLVLLFRQIENLKKAIKLDCLKNENLIKCVPMSIMKLSDEAKKWILDQE